MDRHAAFLAGFRLPELTDQLLHLVMKLGGSCLRHPHINDAQQGLAISRPGRLAGRGELVRPDGGEKAVAVSVE
jgi:hypothetical protein